MSLNEFNNYLKDYPYLAEVVELVLLLFFCLIVYFISKKIIFNGINKFIKRTKTDIDDILLNEKVLKNLSWIPPLLLFNYFTFLFPTISNLISRLSGGLIALFLLMVINTLLSSTVTVLEKFDKFKNKPLKGYVQVVKIIVNIFGTIVIIGILANQSPWTLLSAVGALTAVIILIFKDTILSFVASIQISSYDLVKVGDWIEVPAFGADGDIIDIALHTVKVQNFDKTITVIPTYKLIENSFKNWRGMQESGGRRIKRSIFIDQNSVKFLSQPLLDDLMKVRRLNKYLSTKIKEIEEFNKANNIDNNNVIDARKLTNIGTFRAYLKEYLRERKDIHKDMTFLVRQLPPSEKGLPIEIYVFTTTTNWIEYEEIQADIFDHILSVLHKFELRIFQNPTGNDFKKLGD